MIKKRIAVSLPDKTLNYLEKISKEKGLTKSAMIIFLIEDYFRKELE
ncbi:TPA: CopG family transcriptional regulator, partial [Clostridium perfringens]|nr:CopG family transcriptional regulator [Clostridium perfringens]